MVPTGVTAPGFLARSDGPEGVRVRGRLGAASQARPRLRPTLARRDREWRHLTRLWLQQLCGSLAYVRSRSRYRRYLLLLNRMSEYPIHVYQIK